MPSLPSDGKVVRSIIGNLSSTSGNWVFQICMVVVRLVVIFLENYSVEHGMLV